ncbi:U-box domain-containing protein 35-like isoform X1 [Rhododendron vialii]|uniref:U-box domain-containing protein 35-like isoform X1 n=1 Tax=Rhododendron vialii TaxID=182163 RepID=UPI00265E77AD|nr:U-box domain-containing protein 35-like isoform X1 [Rhododendron vialii]
MWNARGNGNGNRIGNGNVDHNGGEKRDESVTVAIDKDKSSQYALKWAVDNLLSKGQTVTLIHVKQRPASIPTPMGNHVAVSDVNDGVAKAFKTQVDNQAKELFLPFRAFCTRKDIKCNEVIMEDMDIAKVICDFVKANLIEALVVGASSRNSFVKRFKATDVPTSLSKGAPEFCSVYVISKGKISSVRSATAPVPNPPPRPLPNQSIPVIPTQVIPTQVDARPMQNNSTRAAERTPFAPRNLTDDIEIKSPFNRHKASNKSYGDLSLSDTDISFVSSGRPSTERMQPYPSDNQELGPRLSYGSDTDNRSSFGSAFSASRSPDHNFAHGYSSGSESASMSWSSSQNQDEVEAEMRRLKQELKQTMEMYSTACKEALTAKQKAMELHRWKIEEQQRLEQAQLAEEAALAIAEKEKAKTKAAIEAAEAAQRIAELEAQKRMNAEMKALKESEEKKKVLDVLAQSDIRYRKYTIEEIESATENFSNSRKIGEGGYGPVFKCFLDHTPVAVKVLRPDAAQGRSQFQQEVEVLSCIRHPNMVLLLGACPEYGCLVYEYMANGSLEDRLFRRGNTPVLPWQIRFRIAAEIGTGLLFLHQTKPEPLVHRDLKPANILLDRNFVSKISDVGLARLVPPSVANSVTQYRMTSTAGTFCYIDPEYQQTGMLGIKSDIYSLGIMLLQMITAKPPMGLTHHVERAIERGTFAEMVDQSVTDWPLEDAMKFAKLALKCAELRRKDRPDLKTVVLPELNRLRILAEENMPSSVMMMGTGTPRVSPSHSQVSASSQEMMRSDPSQQKSGYGRSQGPFSAS